jgi:hypothetical protein
MSARIRRLFRSLIRQGMRKGWQEGVLGESRTYLILGAIALLAHLAGRAMARPVQVVFSEPLHTGEAFQVFHEPQS